MHAQDLVRGGVGQDLHEAVGLVVDLGPAVGGKGELAGLVGAALGLELLFTAADPGDFGGGVDHAGHQIVVHVTGLAGDQLDAGDGVLLGLVGQHGAVDHVTNGPDTRRRRAEVVGLQEAPGVGHQAHRLQAQARRIGTPADGQEDPVSGQGLGAAARGGLDREVHPGLAGLGAGHLGAETEVDALLGQDPLEGLGDLGVHARADAIQVLDHGYLGAQPAPDRAQLEADDAGSDDH